MQTALVSAPLASTPPQHTPSRPRRTTSGGVVAFRTSDAEAGSYSRGASSVIESGSWRSISSRPASIAENSLVSSSRSIPKSASYVKVEGFDAPEELVASSPPHSPGREIRGASSLLSRQLSVENLSSLPRPVPSPALSAVAERLEAQVAGQPAFKPRSPSQFGVDPAQVFSWLRNSFKVFSEPLVVEAFKTAYKVYIPFEQKGQRALARGLGAAQILAELGADEVAVAGALLHDVLEHTSEPQLRSMLANPEAVELVRRVNHMGYICNKYRNATNTKALAADPTAAVLGSSEPGSGIASHLVELLVAQGHPRALLVRLAVALQEGRALESRQQSGRPSSWAGHAGADEREARRRRYAAEALEVWAPLANRLGVWSLKAELEDRAFKTLRPAEYAELRDRLEAAQEPTKLIALVDALRAQLQAVGVEYLDLSGRPKHLWGVYKKMQTKGYSADRVRDVRGLRVIVKSREDCYLALRAVEKAWAMVGESKNYIKAPKANGYQSLHAVADPGDGHLVEVQIRTDKMHYLAEYGAEAAHWRYKEAATAAAAGGATKEANWAKFVTSQHVARDKKCRPSGSPSGDQSLASILALMDGAGSSSSEDETPVGAAVAGSSPGTRSRTFQEYIAASGQRPEPPEEQRALVAVIAAGNFSVAELPAGTTLGNFVKLCGPDTSSRTVRIVVNRNVQAQASTVLRAGDVVEIYAEPAVPSPVARPPAPAPAPAAAGLTQGNMMPVGALAKKLAATDLSN